MSNEHKQSRSGKKVTLAVICLITSRISPFIFFSSLTASSTFSPASFVSFSILNSHLSKTSLDSTLFTTTTNFLTFLMTSHSWICPNTSPRNLFTASSVDTNSVKPYSCFLSKRCIILLIWKIDQCDLVKLSGGYMPLW